MESLKSQSNFKQTLYNRRYEPSRVTKDRLYKKLFLFFPVGVSLLLASCFSSPQQGASLPSPIERMEPKRPDPIKQRECRQRGQVNCEGEEECEDICNDIFRGRANREDCYEYSLEMVSRFENLLEAAEDGDVDEIGGIGSEVLECMLDIDEREFAKAIRGMSRREAQDFALLIAENEDFAEVLKEEDDEFNILKQLLNELFGSSELEASLSREVEDDKTLLWLFAEYNENVWEWLDGYVSEECDGRDSEDCPGGENIGAYCNALLESGFRENEWEDFLSDAGFFEEEYEEEVEDKDYEYEITDSPSGSGDFRDYCEWKTDSGNNGPSQITPNLGPCPTGRPEANQNLTDFILAAEGQSFMRYRHSDYKDSNGDQFNEIGHADITQDILFYMNFWIRTRPIYDDLQLIVVNQDQISFNPLKTYYIYIDDNKYELTPGQSYTHSNPSITYREFRPVNYLSSAGILRTGFSVAIASEINGDQCEFYVP